jgi:putative ABC transport system permease protein
MITDLRFALRQLRKAPGFTLIAVATLALGIGATTAIFSVVNGVLLKALPFPHPAQLVALRQSSKESARMGVSFPNFLDWRAQQTVFSQMAARLPMGGVIAGEGEPERVIGRAVTANFFQTLEVQPALGRFFSEAEDRPDGAQVIVLSYRLWQRHFGSDPNIVGKAIRFNGDSSTVIGIAPRDFDFYGRENQNNDFFVPLGYLADRAFMRDRSEHMVAVTARLKPQVPQEQARAQMEAIMQRLTNAYPAANTGNKFVLTSFLEDYVGESRRSLVFVFVAVALFLLIACANVANLLLARGAARKNEIAVRVALGATRMRLLRQLLSESVLLSAAGGALGTLLAVWGVDLFQKINAGLLPRMEEVAIDLRVLGFSLLVSLITGLGFGLLPAWQNSNISLQDALSENSRTAAGTGSRRLRSGLVITEVALSLVLLLSAGLLLKSFSRLLNVDPGFRPQNVLTLRLRLPDKKYRDAAQARTFLRETLGRVQALPGVNESCVTTGFPFGRGGETRYWLEGSPEPANTADRPQAITQAISENYYRVLGIQLLAGRLFSEHDTTETEPIVIVDRQFVRRHFPSRSIDQVIGQRLRFDGEGQPWRRIVGIVGEVRQSQLDEQPRAQIYRPWTQMNEAFAPDFLRAMDLLVKNTGAPADLVPAIKSEVQQIDKEQPLGNVAPLESLLDDSITPRRFYAVLLAAFSIVALLLAAIGLYGVMAYTVAQRTREIGIRVALGALRRHILRLVLQEGAVLVLIGAAFGLLAAVASSRLLASLLYGVSPTDPQLYLLLSFLLIAVALFACYLPARRAMKIDPMVALRHE